MRVYVLRVRNWDPSLYYDTVGVYASQELAEQDFRNKWSDRYHTDHHTIDAYDVITEKDFTS